MYWNLSEARCIYGDVSNYTGPNGLQQAANYLTDSLKNWELKCSVSKRLEHLPELQEIPSTTAKMEEQFGDERVVPFFFFHRWRMCKIEQKSCWLAYTNEATHDIIH